jgi:SulP family sulfate permease
MVIMLICALFCSFPVTIALPTVNTTSVLLAISTQIMLFFDNKNNEPAIFATSFVAFGLSTVLTGIAFLAMGYLKKGNIIRFIPYPVICGFMAGIGLVLFNYAVLNINAKFSADSVTVTAATIIFALVAYVFHKIYKRPLFVLVLFFGGIAFFYAFLALKGISYQDAVAHGWLLDLPKKSSYWQLPSPHLFSLVNWHAIYSVSGLILLPIPIWSSIAS